MFTKISIFRMFSILLIVLIMSGTASASPLKAPLGTGFTYQGKLIDGGSPANGSYDFQFRLFDALTSGNQVGGTITRSSVTVTNGLFTVQLDFGNVFNGSARYLEIGVHPVGSGGPYTTLAPLQPLSPTPYALYTTQAGSVPWSGLTSIPTGIATLASLICSNGQILTWNSGAWSCANDNSPSYTAGTGLVLIGGQFSLTAAYSLPQGCSNGQIPKLSGGVWGCATDNNTAYSAGTGLALNETTFNLLASYRLPQGCGNGLIPEWSGSAWVCGNKGSFWSLTGNAGTNPATNYLGTSDIQPLELRVNGQRVLRLEPASTGSYFIPNIIGGYSGNWLAAGVYGATISGGGLSGYENRVTDDYGVIGGGYDNQVGSDDGIIDNGAAATVGGGINNTASGQFATVGGGNTNVASGNYATASGGSDNTAGGNLSFAAGNKAIANAFGAFVWSDANMINYDPLSYPDPGGVADSFNVRATGGVYFVTAINGTTGRPTAGVWLSGSGWNTYSDPSYKQNFKAVDSQAILARLAVVPITSWNYKSQDSSIVHIGPTAPAFNAAFGVGEPDKTGALKYINSLDADGVALASIQALYQRSQEQAVQIQALQDQLAKVERQVSSSPVESPSLPWIAISGFLALLVVLQAIIFFTPRWKSG